MCPFVVVPSFLSKSACCPYKSFASIFPSIALSSSEVTLCRSRLRNRLYRAASWGNTVKARSGCGEDVKADSEDCHSLTPLFQAVDGRYEAVDGRYEAVVRLLVGRNDVEAILKTSAFVGC